MGWHASAETMRRFLDRVGVPQEVLKLIPQVVQTCQVCREWTRPGPDSVCSTEIADTFNTQVECDLLFVEKHIIFHMIDRCTRWHATMLVADTQEATLMHAIENLWVTTHGPPKELIVDGEGGIALSDMTKSYLHRKGIKMHVRGKDQHARFIERRGALLRDQLHKIKSQLASEGLQDTPFPMILSEATFCGNAMLTINGSTPYNAVYGRVPAILPSINQIDAPDAAQQVPLIRHSHRLREISVQAMVEGSARARLGRAMNTRSTLASQHLNLQVGDEVDYFREPHQKDISGWYGPAEVVDVSRQSRGIMAVRFRSKVL